MTELISISDIEVQVRRSERRHTIGLTVERDGSVVAAVPAEITLPEVEKQIRRREMWLQSALAQRTSIRASAPPKQYVSGEGFYYLGEKYRLRVVQTVPQNKETPELRLFRGMFYFRSDRAQRGRETFVRWYSEQAHRWLSDRIGHLSRRVGVEVHRITVMELGYRWASCSAGGRLNFNWRAILLPPQILEYITLHELCHILEHNHTDRFWSLVRRADRDYENKERWLKQNGASFDI